jgi:hypothetical protein
VPARVATLEQGQFRREATSQGAPLPGVPQPRRTRPRVAALFAGALAIGTLLFDLPLIRVGLDPQDEGYFLEQATRVLRGQLPYRDFDSLYTPGLLYVHAALLDLAAGHDVLAVRAVGLVARIVLALSLYALCRPLARPFFAWLPSAYVLIALDTVPTSWEPHPGWPAAALSVLAALAFSRLPEVPANRRPWWLVGVGGLTALAFATKQNVGVFLGIGLAVYLVWHGTHVAESGVVSPWLRVLQVGLVAALAAAVAWLISPHFSPMLAGYFLGPIVIAGVVPLAAVEVSSGGRRVGPVLADVALLGVGFVAVSVPWLIALLVALNGQWELLRGFIGAVNQDILWHPMDLPTNGAWPTVIGVAAALTCAVYLRRRPLGLIAALVVLAGFGAAMFLLTAQPSDSLRDAILWTPARAANGLQGFLPLLAIVAAIAWCLKASSDLTRWRLGWLTIGGAVMFLAEYPRIDAIHLAWSSPLALGAGAVMLDRLHLRLGERWQLGAWSKAVLAIALVLVPLATTLPMVIERAQALLDPPDHTSLSTFTPITGLSGVRGVLANQYDQATLVAATRYAREITQPGEPIFVYPSSPLIYVMADRPNPTRFAHLYPGAATPDQLQQVISTLATVRVAVVNGSDMQYWGPAASNQPLETYLANNYQEVGRFGDYRVLASARQ